MLENIYNLNYYIYEIKKMNYYIVNLKKYNSYNNPKHIKSQFVESVYKKTNYGK